MQTTFKTFIKEIKKGEKTYQFITLWYKENGKSTFFELGKTPNKDVKKHLKNLATDRCFITLNENEFSCRSERVEKNGKTYINNYIDILVEPIEFTDFKSPF